MDEQRCSFEAEAEVEVPAAAAAAANGHLSAAQDAFLDQLAGLQAARMNDQRAVLPPACVPSGDKENQLLDDSFFEILMRCQVSQEWLPDVLDLVELQIDLRIAVKFNSQIMVAW